MRRESTGDEKKDRILQKGTEVTASIVSCVCSDDPADDEHTVFEIHFEYFINEITVEKSVSFSINTTHIAYAAGGGLLHVPKLKYNVDDFKKALSTGGTLDIVSMETPPYEYVNKYNKVAREIMQYPQMWM